MPNPTSADLNYNQVLTDFSIAFVQDDSAFVAGQVFPVVPTEHQSGSYKKYLRGDWFRDDAEERSPGTESSGQGWALDTDGTFFNRVYGNHVDVDDQTRANYREPIDADRDGTNLVTQRLLLKREIKWANQYFKAGVWTTDYTGVPGAPAANQVKQWDQAGSTPIEDVATLVLLVEALTGKVINTMVIHPKVFNALKNHAEILDRIKYTQRGIVTLELLASLFELDKVLIARGIVNSAKKGVADAMGFVMSKGAFLCYAEPAPGIMKASAGYIFAWTGYAGAEAYAPAISNFRMQHLKSDRIEGEMAFDPEVVAPDLGIFIASAVS